MRTEPDNCTPRLLSPARSGEGQYCAILASLQAVRPRRAAGAAPRPRLPVPHAPNTPKTTRKTVTTTTNPALTSSAASGMTPIEYELGYRKLTNLQTKPVAIKSGTLHTVLSEDTKSFGGMSVLYSVKKAEAERRKRSLVGSS
jgi:hypothetical protein